MSVNISGRLLEQMYSNFPEEAPLVTLLSAEEPQACSYTFTTDQVEDEAVTHFIEFVCAAYDDETLEENLRFVAGELDSAARSTACDVILSHFLKKLFFEHCKTYEELPIHWLFDLGKKNGFKSAACTFRYQPDLLARIRACYVHSQQGRYRLRRAYLDDSIAASEECQKAVLSKERKRAGDQAVELVTYEEKLHHLADQMVAIDLDDDVMADYAKFQDVLAKIK